MNNIIYTHPVLAACLVAFIAVVIVLACVLVDRWLKKRKTALARKSATDLLREAQRTAHLQYAKAQQYLDGFTPTKPNDIRGFRLNIMLPDGIGKPSSLLAALSARAGKEGEKLAARLLELRDETRHQHTSLQEYLQSYETEARRNEQAYFENLVELSKMHDELGRYMANKNFDKGNGAAWYEGYFAIFGAWFRKGAIKDMDVTHTEIVTKVIALNQQYRFIPFVIQTTACSLNCDTAYNRIKSLNADLQERIGRYAYQHKTVYKVARFILQKWMAGEERPKPIDITVPVVAQRENLSWEQSVDGAVILPPQQKRFNFGHLRLALVLVLLAACFYFLYSFADSRTKEGRPIADNRITETNLQPANNVVQPPAPAAPLPPNDTTDFRILFDAYSQISPYVYGIDISKYQGKLIEDAESLDTLHFLICKATEGRTTVDPDFETNWNFIRDKGLIRGAYHFFHSEDEPDEQASLFLQTVQLFHSNDIAPIVDVEAKSLKGKVSAQQLDSQLLVFLDYVEKKTGRRPVIYSNYAFANLYLTNDSLANYPLWLAEYSGKKRPSVPTAWKDKGYVLWQRSSTYDIDSQQTDFDIFNGNGQAFIQFIRNN